MAQEGVELDLSCSSEFHSQHLCYMASQGFHLSDQEEYRSLVQDPQFKCQNCGRVARSDKNLCQPVKL
jgi:hypothetical protein